MFRVVISYYHAALMHRKGIYDIVLASVKYIKNLIHLRKHCHGQRYTVCINQSFLAAVVEVVFSILSTVL